MKQWPSDSMQYKERIDTVENFLNDTGYPVSLVNKPCFIAMLTLNKCASCMNNGHWRDVEITEFGSYL